MKLIMSFLILLMSMPTFSASITAKLDRSQIQMGETVNLIITSEGMGNVNPDVSVLDKDFRVLGSSVNSRFEMVNGHSHSQTDYIVTISPRREGNLLIPDISVGNEKTQPLSVTVTAEPQQKPSGELPDAFLEVSIHPSQGFVQQQFIYTVKLYASRPIANGQIEPPHSNQVKMTPVDEDHRYVAIKSGKEYQIYERNFLVLPEKSGEIVIEPPYFTGMQMNVASAFSMAPDFPKPIQLQAKAIKLNIQPKPANYQGNAWLPAERVSLMEKWSSELNHWHVGEPITRSIQLQVIGLSGDQLLFPVMENIHSLKVYPDKSVRNTAIVDNKVVGTLSMKVAMVPMQAGSLNLPPIEVSWWDVTSHSEKVAKLPARTLQILASQGSDDVSPQSSSSNQTSTVSINANSRAFLSQSSNYWLILVGVLLLGWLSTVMLWWWQRRSSNTQRTQSLVDTPFQPDHLKALKMACLRNDKKAAVLALSQWASEYWPDGRQISLGEIGKRLGSPSLVAAISHLEAANYGQSQGEPWDGNLFWVAFDQAKKPPGNANDRKESSLPPLNPQNP